MIWLFALFFLMAGEPLGALLLIMFFLVVSS